ncbi:MAG: hypothetical protein A3K76_05320 [Euryarchaeota archaeon RBG_13_57_23]|nr:MAG: hypothetical protein A3K76_05320 [Euryarchaeota archaeon RBG_13_57_23]
MDPVVTKVLNVRVSDVDNDILNVTWDWGDGSPTETNTTGPALIAIRVYNEHMWDPEIEQGTGGFNVSYTLRVTVDDGHGNYAWVNTTVTCVIPDNFGPSSDLEGPSSPVTPTESVILVAKANDFEGEPLTWTFVFNDTMSDFLTLVYYTPASDPATWVWNNITHVFGSEGLFNVTLFVSDALGLNQTGLHNTSDRASVWVAENQPPMNTQIFSIPQDPVINCTEGHVDVTLIIEVYDSEGDVITAVWGFGDGSPAATNSTPGGAFVYTFRQLHMFTGPGEFNVTANLTDGVPGNEVVEFLILNITSNNLPPGVVLFSYAAHGAPGNLHVFVGEDVTFEILLTDAEMDDIELVVDFGDGSPPSYYNLTEYSDGNVSCQENHTYSAPGYYTIMIRYTDNEVGLLDHSLEYSDTIHVVVDDVPPTADAGDDQVVYAPCTVYFDGTGSLDNWGIANYTWTFVYNGSPVVLWGSTPSFEFWSLQTYHVWLTVTDMSGYSDSTIVTIEVAGFIPEYLPALPALIVMVLVPLLHIVRRKKGVI